jgi:CBS domain-containing protein
MKGDDMKVSDIMTHDPVCCTPENSLVEVAKMMKECDCGALPVVQDQAGKKPAGIITDRDMVVRAMADAKDPFLTTVAECMTKSLVTVAPEDDVDECIRLMEKHQVRRILAVNDQNEVVGIVAQAQVALNSSKKQAGEMIQDISKP